ncbi:PAS domain-containing protein [Halarcobacter sp.]|uniref:PAS domain-containing protein n=1 Tax=Halarcobacter sp. TaxID=2321133 RepID=UPI002AABC909|nr:PAS domain-containing protein [Halarcobacter sp.]
MSKEILLDKKTMIVSETNKKGIIIYANEDFCKISGYTKDELIGNPHNMVRHKDMPKKAFKDLWNTVEKNMTWNGIVKNKTKNGDYYWVNATVFSSEDGLGNKRYISVRVQPTDDEKILAQNSYNELLKEENVFN